MTAFKAPPDNSQKHATLARKLLILGALPAIVMFVALMLFFTHVRLQDASEQVAQNSQVLADSLAPALEYAVVSGNNSVLQDILSESLRRSQARWIRVANVRGNVLGFVSRDLPEKTELQAAVESRFANSAVPAMLNDIYTAEILQKPLNMAAINTPEWFDPGMSFVGGALRVGSVYVGVDPTLLEAKRRGILWTSLALGVSLLFITICLVNYFLTAILRPMRSIALRIDALGRHDYRVKPVNHHRSSRELVVIEGRLNELAEHLADLRAAQETTLTQTRSTLEQAERDSHAKSEFMAIISHELQTPLQSVLSMLGLIKRESLSASQSESLNTARRAAEDLLLVINDILEYSRLERGAAVLRSYPFDLHQLIHNCVASHGQLAAESGLALKLEFHHSFPEFAMVHGDAPKLRQILAGLLDSSIKSSHDGSISIEACLKSADTTQTLTLHTDDEQLPAVVLLSVAVSEAGAQSSLPLMDANFDRLDEFEKPGHSDGGAGVDFAGLTLPLVQRLIELMGGTLNVEIDAKGHSLLRFEIPFER